MTVTINNAEFILLPEKALFKPDESLLIIADVHLGKATHFRKAGIPLPAHSQMSDFDNLEQVIRKTGPKKVYFLGDLFHSKLNRDWAHFCVLIAKFPKVEFILIKGNHDIIHHSKFDELCIKVVAAVMDENFVYTHDPLDEVPQGKMNFAGHIHPGVVLSGMARQSVKLPCFYLTGEHCIVPAFGVLTGLYSMDKNTATCIYMVLPDNSIRKLQA